MGRPVSWIGMLVGMGLWFVPRYYFGVPFDTMFAGLAAIGFVVLIGYPLGLMVGHFMVRDSDVDTTPYRIIAGANVLAWLIPVAGMTLSAATTRFSRQSETTPTLYSLLACVGAWLAIANAGIGGAREYQNRHYGALPVAHTEITPASTTRSTERCPFAAQEVWSHEDVVKYCGIRK